MLSNHWDSEVDVQVKTYSTDGAPLTFEIEGVESAFSEWRLLGRTSRTLRLEAAEGLLTGWLSLISDRQVGATLRLQWLGHAGNQQGLVSLEPSLEACQYVVEGRRNVEAGTSTGLAVSNPFEQDDIEVIIELFSEETEVVGFHEMRLSGMYQWARAPESVAPGLESFSGTIRIRSNRPILVTAVGTVREIGSGAIRGSGFCEVPAGTVVRRW